MIRFTFVTMAEGDYRLVVANHHIILDGWSVPLLLQNLLALYATRGDDSVLPRVVAIAIPGVACRSGS